MAPPVVTVLFDTHPVYQRINIHGNGNPLPGQVFMDLCCRGWEMNQLFGVESNVDLRDLVNNCLLQYRMSLNDLLTHIAYEGNLTPSEAFTLLADIIYGHLRVLMRSLDPIFQLHLGPYVLVDNYRIKEIQYDGLSIIAKLVHEVKSQFSPRVYVNPFANPIVRADAIREAIIDGQHWHRDVHPAN